jgi:hypothetical protein
MLPAEVPDMSAREGGRRHSRWGVVAQVTAIVGAVVLVLAIALVWVVYSTASQRVNGLMGDLDTAVAEAQGKYDAAGAALDEQAGVAPNPDAQVLLQDGADLVRDIGAQMASIEAQIESLVNGLLAGLLAIVGLLTALLAYLILVHAGIWTLGRHWRRDGDGADRAEALRGEDDE